MGTHPLTHKLARARPPAFQSGVVGKDRRLEPLQFEAWLDPELTDQHLAGAREALERLGLAPGSVQGNHELTPPPFAQRLFPDHGLELGDQLIRIPGGEPGVHAILGFGASSSSSRSPSAAPKPVYL